jgi:hypothetical protein
MGPVFCVSFESAIADAGTLSQAQHRGGIAAWPATLANPTTTVGM